MQDAALRDKVSLGHDKVNVKRMESLSATICNCRSLQKINCKGLFSIPGLLPCNTCGVPRPVTSRRFDHIYNCLAISATVDDRHPKFLGWFTGC